MALDICGGGDWDLWDIHGSWDEDVDFAGARIPVRKAVPQHLVGVPRIGGRHKKEILVLLLEELLDILDIPRRPQVEDDDVDILSCCSLD